MADIPNLPVNLFIRNPLVTRMTSLQFGILMRLIINYWETGIPLPESDNGLIVCAQCNLKHWAIGGSMVREVLKQVMPRIEEFYGRRMKIKAKNQILLLKARNSPKFLEKKRPKPKNILLNDERLSEELMQPIKSPQFKGTGAYDDEARSLAIKVASAYKSASKVTLRDKKD